jgi:catechol 2,3-dioxygenase-like lactoylglutathione lyase family enzyme
MDCVAFGQASWRLALFLEPVTSRTSLFMIREMKSVVLVSDTPDATAAFYRDVLGLPLEEEEHRGTLRHYACQLQSIHFAIHARDGFWLETSRSPEPATSIVSFTVLDMPALEKHLAAKGVAIVARTKIGPMDYVALRDPDGRSVCCGTPWPES